MAAPTQGPGTYFDGSTGDAHPVTVTLEDAALAISAADGTPLGRWAYAEIERLDAPEHRLRLGRIRNASTARLEVRDPAFADAVKERLDLRTAQVEAVARRRRHHVVEWSIAGVAAVLLIGVAGMPVVADLLLPFIPATAEAQIAAAAYEVEKADYKEKGPYLCGDESNKERAGKAVFLRLIGRLEAAAGLPIPLHPFVIRTRVVNAGAAGGYVLVNYGLMNYARTPEELAAIIGHELGHVAHRDMTRGVLHQAGLAYLFGVVLGDVIGSSGLSYAGYKILWNHNSRAQEAAADLYGVELMRKLGFNPYGGADFFERVSKDSEPSRDMLLLEDHPTDASRVAAIRAMPPVPNPQPVMTPEEWQTLRRVCSPD